MSEMKIIGHVLTDFADKFGVPRQSGIVDTKARIVFEPEYRVPEAFRGLEGYSHLWIIWMFSKAVREKWSPTVRPPRLGGNKRLGVFATRSPFRPNPIGLSSVKLERIEFTRDLGPVLHISGADMVSGTPVYDIKPYLAYTDSHSDAIGGFSDSVKFHTLEVVCDEALLCSLPESLRETLPGVLAHDPRPSYQHDDDRIYGFEYGGYEVRFTVSGDTLTVTEITSTLNPRSLKG
ncbi:MAG: tRNA (N6-threonylcarbamoyladenosine(37)-N6)-methyltransferase TrmO [Ruminococcaceae bacterium]|nr:tRNA (N6-threonylcarbamoyladenosine(37)-N6)-methyltransferase TrmO [Oscillospiraceae bacterium]